MSFLIEAPDIARYLVSNGNSIRIEALPGATTEAIDRFLGMAPLAALVYQRGMLAFHAAACAPPCSFGGEGQRKTRNQPGAILVVGDSGVGKSTLVATLEQRGWRVLSDDLAIVDLNAEGQPVVLPNPSDIVLWPDAAAKLGAVPVPDRSVTLDADESVEEIPLSAIYLLSVHNKDAITTDSVTGAKKFRALGHASYNSRIADILVDHAEYIRKAGAIAFSVPIRKLMRPRGDWTARKLADLIEADLVKTSPGATDFIAAEPAVARRAGHV